MIQISRYCFHLSEEHDGYLIDFIHSHKNQSRIIRDLLRLAYKALHTNDAPKTALKNMQNLHTKDTPKDMKKETTPETKKPPNEKIQWKIPKN